LAAVVARALGNALSVGLRLGKIGLECLGGILGGLLRLGGLVEVALDRARRSAMMPPMRGIANAGHQHIERPNVTASQNNWPAKVEASNGGKQIRRGRCTGRIGSADEGQRHGTLALVG
jgi:hypothetical protein